MYLIIKNYLGYHPLIIMSRLYQLFLEKIEYFLVRMIRLMPSQP